jgi:hypothetical protein
VIPKTAGGVLGKYTLICELGGRAPTTFAAYTSALGELVIVESLARAGLSAKEIDTFTRTARRIALVKDPNLPHVRDVVVTPLLVAIASAFVEGETLAELTSPIEGKKRLELAVRLTILVDLLVGLDAIHTAPELEKGKEPKPIVHGEVTPANVLVGLDGTTRIIRPHRVPRRGPILPEDVMATLGYVAPETLVGDGPDVRADLYAVGVMLWEAISGDRLFAQSTPEAALTLQLACDLPRARLPDDAAWAEPLVNIAARALQVSPERRFPTAKDFSDAIRRAVGPKLAPTLQVAATVSARAGEKIEARRVRLKPPHVASAAKVSAPLPARAEAQTEELGWTDVVETKATARSMPPPVPSRKPSRGPSKAPSGATQRIDVPSMVQPQLPTIIALDTLVPSVAAPPFVEAPTRAVVEAPDTTPDVDPRTTDDTQPTRFHPSPNSRFAIVAGLVALCVVILAVAAIRVAVAPKDSAPLAKKSEPVMASLPEAPPLPPPPPPPTSPPIVAPPPEPLPVVAEAPKATRRPATPKPPKPRPKSNYEPQGI